MMKVIDISRKPAALCRELSDPSENALQPAGDFRGHPKTRYTPATNFREQPKMYCTLAGDFRVKGKCLDLLNLSSG